MTRCMTVHETTTAKVVELIGTSTTGFEDAIKNCVKDASTTTRGIRGCEVQNMNVKVENGKIVEYRVDLKAAFGVER